MRERFGLYLVLSDPVAGYEACTQAAVAEGVRYVQLRMKHATQPEVLAVGRRLRDLTRGTDTRFIVNDDVDVAIACSADGVHLGQTDMSLSEARRRWKTPGKIFGQSTHDKPRDDRWSPAAQTLDSGGGGRRSDSGPGRVGNGVDCSGVSSRAVARGQSFG